MRVIYKGKLIQENKYWFIIRNNDEGKFSLCASMQFIIDCFPKKLREKFEGEEVCFYLDVINEAILTYIEE